MRQKRSMQKLPKATMFKTILCLSMCITTYLSASVGRQAKQCNSLDLALLQPIFISQSTTNNSITLEAYLPKERHRVKLYCTDDPHAPSKKRYSGYFFAIYYKKLTYSVEEPCTYGPISMRKEKNHRETASTCLIGEKKSEQLFKHYQELLNRALENRD